jgi:hypothetical protein
MLTQRPCQLKEALKVAHHLLQLALLLVQHAQLAASSSLSTRVLQEDHQQQQQLAMPAVSAAAC